MTVFPTRFSLGLIGCGAFGRMMMPHLSAVAEVRVYDPAVANVCSEPCLMAAAGCDVVVMAVPVGELRAAVRAVRPYLKNGVLVVDVGSVKIVPVQILREELPETVRIAGLHPLFGPQSAALSVAGHLVVVCPVRGDGVARWLAVCLRRWFGVEVCVMTAEAHDREMAVVQGVTHLVGRVMAEMGVRASGVTTRSFECLMEAVEMVRHDAPGVGDAIARLNPYVGEVRRTFLAGVRREVEGQG